MNPAFLITIDTEGDNLWSNPVNVTTENAKFIPRFQAACEKYGFKPTYLTNYEMAMDEYFQKIGKAYHHQGKAEIGTHVHAWDAPPVHPAYGSHEEHAYLFELPDDLLREKMVYQTELIEERFELKPTSFRAGKWGMTEREMRLLADLGYTTDCSVTPFVSWKRSPGLANGEGGSDYRFFPNTAYFINLEDMSRPGESQLLELPMTIMCNYSEAIFRAYDPFHPTLPGKVFRKVFGQPVSWLRPDIGNLKDMKKVVDWAIEEEFDYIEFMLHSSEFMPGGSPTFKTNESIELMYKDLDALFAYIAEKGFVGKTLSEYRAEF